MFIDIAKIKVKAGNGGAGAVSFYRENMWLPAGRTAAMAAEAAILFSKRIRICPL